ncbi:MAG: hypothetical protein U1F10_01670 [Burkholderiales bacterium]
MKPIFSALRCPIFPKSLRISAMPDSHCSRVTPLRNSSDAIA